MNEDSQDVEVYRLTVEQALKSMRARDRDDLIQTLQILMCGGLIENWHIGQDVLTVTAPYDSRIAAKLSFEAHTEVEPQAQSKSIRPSDDSL